MQNADAYNAYFGRERGAPIDFATMSLNGVMAFQWALINARRYPHDTVGRYSFTSAELKTLKAELRLTGLERFTPELQDRLADAMIARAMR